MVPDIAGSDEALGWTLSSIDRLIQAPYGGTTYNVMLAAEIRTLANLMAWWPNPEGRGNLERFTATWGEPLSPAGLIRALRLHAGQEPSKFPIWPN